MFQALKMKVAQGFLDNEDEDIFENDFDFFGDGGSNACLLYTSPSPRD